MDKNPASSRGFQGRAISKASFEFKKEKTDPCCRGNENVGILTQN